MCRARLSGRGRVVGRVAFGLALLLFPAAGGDCLSDSASGVIEGVKVAPAPEEWEYSGEFCPVGMGQVWDASLIPALRRNGFTGSLIQFYKGKSPAELRAYMEVAARHGFWVMPSVRAEYLDNNGQRLAELAAVTADYPNLWGWHCEGEYTADKDKMALIRDIVGQQFVVLFDNTVYVDETITHRYSRLWYPKVRADTQTQATPVYTRARPALYSTFPLRLLQATVRPPNTFEVWLQAMGIDSPDEAHLPSSEYYIPPNVEDTMYWALVARHAGASAIWWYTLSRVDPAGNHLPLWDVDPAVWDAVCRATDFVRTGQVAEIDWTGQFLEFEEPLPAPQQQTSAEPVGGPLPPP